MSIYKASREKEKRAGFDSFQKLHPYKTFLFFALLGSTVVFLSLVSLFILRISLSPSMEDFTFPKSFIVSTVILLLSSFSISRGVKAFRDDDLKELFISLLATLVLAIAFAGSQYTGWKKLYDAGFYLSTQAGVSFLYIISGLHLLHVMAGILVLAWLCISTGFKLTDDVQGLVYLSNRFEELKLELFTIYWHFVDFLWLCLFFVFLFTF